ncbi:putative Thaumatin family [Helianthus debilis subsp. tardiflorus]
MYTHKTTARDLGRSPLRRQHSSPPHHWLSSRTESIELHLHSPSWSGRIWGRTLCSTDSTGRFTYVTGDCGSGTVECNDRGAAPPATLAEFTLNGTNGMDFYDVSLVDGYNLPMMVVPEGESGGNCNVTGCMADLNKNCPSELRLTGASESAACRSACEAFGDPKYCCSGAYSTPQTCNPTSFSQYFTYSDVTQLRHHFLSYSSQQVVVVVVVVTVVSCGGHRKALLLSSVS